MSSDAVVKCILDPDALLDYAETLLPLVEECKLHISSDGFHALAVDPGNIALIQCELGPQGFEALDAPGQATVGVNLDRLTDFVEPASKRDELVEVVLNMETRKLELTYGTTDTDMALIDPEAIRNEPDIPDLDLPNTAVVDAADLDHAVDIAAMMGDHITIEGRPDDREVAFMGQGDTDSGSVTLSDGDLIDARVDERTESVLSLQYVEKIVGPMPSGAEVTLTFGQEMPLRLDWATMGGNLTVLQNLAPRIQSK